MQQHTGSSGVHADFMAGFPRIVAGLVAIVMTHTSLPLALAQPPAADGKPGLVADAPGLVLEQVWTAVRDHFVDPGCNGLDWESVRRETEEAVRAATSPRAVSIEINRMLARLETSHTFYWTTADIEYYHLLGIFQQGPLKDRIAARFPPHGKITYCGIGVLPQLVDGRWFVAGVLDGSVADQAGLRRGLELVSVDGQPYEPVGSFVGRAGEEVSLEVRESPAGATRVVRLTPTLIDPNQILLDGLKNSCRIIERDGKRIAYAHLWSWAGSQYQEALEQELLAGSLRDADGLVLDLREGWGGASPAYLNLFNRRLPQLVSVSRTGTVHNMDSTWRKPVTLLVNRGSRSGKEVIAWGFRNHGIGSIVGTVTGGAVSGGSPFLIGEQGVLYLAVSAVKVDGVNLEGKGVAPDHEVEWPLAWCTAGDPQLEKAVAVTAGQSGFTGQKEPVEQGPPLAIAPPEYFQGLVEELQRKWPRNRSIRIVAHGHSVPAGYFRTPEVRTFDAYPSLIQRELGERFPVASINMIVTAMGGEDSAAGAARFERDVLALRPDLVLVDYALNDRRIGLEAAEKAWRSMIEAGQKQQVRLVLFTPTPDLSVDIEDPEVPLAEHARMIRSLAGEYQVPLVDSWAAFQTQRKAGRSLAEFMSQSNHPNRAGHEVVARAFALLFSDR